MTPGGFPFPFRKRAQPEEEAEGHGDGAREQGEEGEEEEEEEIEGPDPTAVCIFYRNDAVGNWVEGWCRCVLCVVLMGMCLALEPRGTVID